MNTILNLIEGLKMKIEALEKLSHEPQNYKKKCDDMEARIVVLEGQVVKVIRYNKKDCLSRNKTRRV